MRGLLNQFSEEHPLQYRDTDWVPCATEAIECIRTCTSNLVLNLPSGVHLTSSNGKPFSNEDWHCPIYDMSETQHRLFELHSYLRGFPFGTANALGDSHRVGPT